jgi:hypothetical protein
MLVRVRVLQLAAVMVLGLSGVGDSVSQQGNESDGLKHDDTFPLVTLQSGPSGTCAGGNLHRWPVGMDALDCHGWQAVDPTGRVHGNSANSIRCNPDGTFSFTQYAGNLECGGSGVTKTYAPNTCQQDIPPRLHTSAIDLTCCSHPNSDQCKRGVPSVSVPGATIFLNGREILR